MTMDENKVRQATVAADPPATSARKADWVDHAISQGRDPDEAASMTKEQLIAEHGSSSGPSTESEPGTYADGQPGAEAEYEVLRSDHIIRGRRHQVGSKIMLTSEEGQQLTMARAVVQRADSARQKPYDHI